MPGVKPGMPSPMPPMPGHMGKPKGAGAGAGLSLSLSLRRFLRLLRRLSLGLLRSRPKESRRFASHDRETLRRRPPREALRLLERRLRLPLRSLMAPGVQAEPRTDPGAKRN